MRPVHPLAASDDGPGRHRGGSIELIQMRAWWVSPGLGCVLIIIGRVAAMINEDLQETRLVYSYPRTGAVIFRI
jgi:hypothetical protein